MNKGLGLGALAQAARRAVSAVTFLFRDDFTTNESAPLTSPRTAEPGPGIGVVTDGTNIISIENQNIVFRGTPAANSSYRGPAQTRAAGLVLYIKNINVVLNLGDASTIGWANSTSADINAVQSGLYIDDTGLSSTPLRINGAFKNLLLSAINGKDIYIIARSNGFFCVFDDTLEYVADVENNGTIYPVMSARGNGTQGRDFVFDNFRVSQLPAPWDTDYGIATDRNAGVVAAGTPLTSEADFWNEITATTIPGAGDEAQIRVREQDSSNYWEYTVDENGDYVLNEVVAGSPTPRAISAGVIANSDRLVMIGDDETLKGYEANTLRLNYAGAANFKTETAGGRYGDGAFNNHVSFPRTLSGVAKAALDNVADA